MQRIWPRCALGAALLGVALLTGCALPRAIDSDVQRFAEHAPMTLPSTFRFERLPSQSDSAEQSNLEALAAPVLAQHGLAIVNDTGTLAAYSVQIEYSMRAHDNPTTSRNPRNNIFWGMGVGVGNGHTALWLNVDPPWYEHALHVVLRDAAGKVRFEARAIHDGPWHDVQRLFPPILEAALRDFPNASNGTVREIVELAPQPKD